MDRIATAIHFGHDWSKLNALSLKDRRPASCNKGRPSKALGAEEWGFDMSQSYRTTLTPVKRFPISISVQSSGYPRRQGCTVLQQPTTVGTT